MSICHRSLSHQPIRFIFSRMVSQRYVHTHSWEDPSYKNKEASPAKPLSHMAPYATQLITSPLTNDDEAPLLNTCI